MIPLQPAPSQPLTCCVLIQQFRALEPACGSYVELGKPKVLHDWKDKWPHPPEGVDVMIATSAGDAFVRRMAKRGTEVILTSERDAMRCV